MDEKTKILITDLIKKRPLVKTELFMYARRSLLRKLKIEGYMYWANPKYIDAQIELKKTFDEMVEDGTIIFKPRKPLKINERIRS